MTREEYVELRLENYVEKDGSKVLSTNDYTTAEKTKLSGIADNAQVNVIETIKLNGVALTVINKAVNINVEGCLSTTVYCRRRYVVSFQRGVMYFDDSN